MVRLPALPALGEGSMGCTIPFLLWRHGQTQWLKPTESKCEFAPWVEAAAPELGFAQGEFLAAHKANRQRAAQLQKHDPSGGTES